MFLYLSYDHIIRWGLVENVHKTQKFTCPSLLFFIFGIYISVSTNGQEFNPKTVQKLKKRKAENLNVDY